MGQRLSVLWHLFGGPEEGAVRPAVVVAPVRALLQRLGPWQGAARPLVVEAGGRLDATATLERLVAAGYRREHQVEHRGEVAVRGGIIDVFPSTADSPVRIDLWGDEVDRLTAFDVGDQRSVADLGLGGRLRLPGAAHLATGPVAGAGASRRRAVGAHPVGAAGRRRAVRRDGVVAAVARARRAARHRPPRRRCPGGAGRAQADPRPGPRAPRRGGRAGRGAGRHLGRGSRRRRGGRPVPAPVLPLRPAARAVAGAHAVAGLGGRGALARRSSASGVSSRWPATPARLARAGDVAGRRRPVGHPLLGHRRRCGAPVGRPGRGGRPGAGGRPRRPGPGGTGGGGRAQRRVRPAARPGWRCWPSPTSRDDAPRTARPGRGRARPTASSTTSRPGASWSTASTGWPATPV